MDKEWFRELFLHAASGHLLTNILAKKMHRITGDNRFDVEYEYDILSSDSDFKKCSLEPKKDIFSCYTPYLKQQTNLSLLPHIFNVGFAP